MKPIESSKAPVKKAPSRPKVWRAVRTETPTASYIKYVSRLRPRRPAKKT